MNRATGKIFILALLAANPTLPLLPRQQELDLDLESAFDLTKEAEHEPGESVMTDAKSSELNLKRLLLPMAGNEKTGANVVVRLENLRVETFYAGIDDQAFLSTHLLDKTCIELLKKNLDLEFQNRRKTILCEHFRSFILDRMGDVNDHRPSIRSITNVSSLAQSVRE